MPAVTFPRTSTPGFTPQENGGRLINAIVEKLSDGAGAPLVWRRAPGLRPQFTVPGHVHVRGFINVNGVVAVAVNDRIYSVTRAGTVFTVTDLGSLPGTNPVTFARNNKAPAPDIVVVADATAYTLDLTTGLTAYPDPDVGSPATVTAGEATFFFSYGDGSMIASDVNSTVINSLSNATAESSPDTLRRVVFIGGRLVALGAASIELWSSGGQPNAVGFPLNREAVIPRGVCGAWAVTGFEEGWSNALIFVGDDNVVYQLNGNTPQPISTPDISRLIERQTDKTIIEACCFMCAGHAYAAITLSDSTWVYDLTTGGWHERQSYGGTRWRACAAVRAFDGWLIGDRETGDCFLADESYQREGNDPLIFDITSVQNSGFPNRAAVSRFEAQFVPGTGVAAGDVPIQTAPVVLMRYSNDGGFTWSMPRDKPLGGQGNTKRQIRWDRCGATGQMGRQWRLTVSDPVYVGLMGASMDTEARM